MMKMILTAIFMVALPASSFASEENQPDFFDVVGGRVQECEKSLDIKPYYDIAIGEISNLGQLSDEVRNSLKDFGSTGRIVLTEGQEDPQAVKCAIYAEGMLAGGIGRELHAALMTMIEAEIKGGSGMKKVAKEIAKAIGEAVKQSLSQEDQKK